jgi:hypothetical protein
MAERSFNRRGVDVTIREEGDSVELELNGHPVDVSRDPGGRYSSQFAHMFKTFESVDEIVDTLLENEGKTWTLTGGPGGHEFGLHGQEQGGGGGHEHGAEGGRR